MSESADIFVRGRCACGKRFRIRNAQAGAIVTCPNCKRPIPITEADVRGAAAGEPLLPVQSERAEPAEGILLDTGPLRPAVRGSRPGVSGATELGHDDAALTTALRGGYRRPSAGSGGGSTGAEQGVGDEAPPVVCRSFGEDLLASLVLVRKPGNWVHLGAGALLCALPSMVGILAQALTVGVLMFVVGVAVLLAQIVVAIYIVQFYWRALLLTAEGEDEIPAIAPDGSVWDDAVKPFLWIVAITLFCGLPALVVHRYVPASVAPQTVLLGAALLAGAVLWPVAVMSVALGGTLLYLRPDWLVRCIVGIGPVYLVAWLLVVATAGALAAFKQAAELVAGWSLLAALAHPLVSAFVNLYLGYVLFRTLGLLYRHFRRRFPWRF